ncbi:hypothetical protein CDD81_1768 [Ophiocordyceps australis]|uniref:Uncharacterized protein n=1 Tax=Ophiocordyceps australis TaxID=1399860 RepID=A0A2C5YEG9_9HYPO|nr:hypothetical protein CDD81_1768 [Ophiocordyceps australis]
MSEVADLRIASKYLAYDNSTKNTECVTIALYIYNAGPNEAKATKVKAGFSWNMDYNKMSAIIRETTHWGQLSHVVRGQELSWEKSPRKFESTKHGWDMVTTLGDVAAGTVVELCLSFPTTDESSYKDWEVGANVESDTVDPDESNTLTTYIITPRHHDEGRDYWNKPGYLSNLDIPDLINAKPLFLVDLRIASALRYYDNNVRHHSHETLTFFVVNHGPTTARKPILKAQIPDGSKSFLCSGEKALAPCEMDIGTGGGISSVETLRKMDKYAWKSFGSLEITIDENLEAIVCPLPNLHPGMINRIRIKISLSCTTTKSHKQLTASISSQNEKLEPSNDSTRYWMTQTHEKTEKLNGVDYWEIMGDMAELNKSAIDYGSRANVTGWSLETPILVSGSDGYEDMTLDELVQRGGITRQVIGLDTPKEMRQLEKPLQSKLSGPESRIEETMKAKTFSHVERGYSANGMVVYFSADTKNQQSYTADPDTLVYLEPAKVKVDGSDTEVCLGSWIPVKKLWTGARVKGVNPEGLITSALVTGLQQLEEKGQDGYLFAAPSVVSQSHSYVVGKKYQGGILVHNGRDWRPKVPGQVGSSALFVARAIRDRLVATTTPGSTFRHGMILRQVRPLPQQPHLPPRRHAVLPHGIPARDEGGNWLIYLYETDTPAVVENARFAVYHGGHPWRLTYDPDGADDRRNQSLRGSPPQGQLLEIQPRERRGSYSGGQLDRDEYPPAVAQQGGPRAFVAYIDSTDNRRAGAVMGMQLSYYTSVGYKGHVMQAGDYFRFAIIHDDLRTLEYLGDGVGDETQIERPPANHD